MTTCSYSIVGGDYDHAGSASRNLKDLLKSVGVDPNAVRRLMVAAYEAEMNVIIHASCGTLQATVADSTIRVDVTDEGPGIADIPLAMKEGYSTAPDKARALGFGAGLGLPNIKRHSDSLEIRSEVGRGTSVSFSVRVEPLHVCDRTFNSLRLRGELCRQCLRCVHVCPTQAMRVHRGVPHVLAHLCIECSACISQCPTAALGMEGPSALGEIPSGAALLLPPAFLFQFGCDVDPSQVLVALEYLGFGPIYLSDSWEQAHRAAVLQLVGQRDGSGPVISSRCPAVLGLVESRFPSLLPDVAPFAVPEESGARDLAEHTLMVPICPSQRSSLLAYGIPESRLLHPAPVRDALRALLRRNRQDCGERRDLRQAPIGTYRGVLRVDGIHAVCRTLEELEDGRLSDIALLELFACDHGCFGSGLLPGNNAALAAHLWQFMASKDTVEANAWPRKRSLSPRSGFRLDPDMGEAMAKLNRIAELVVALPGRDCGQCGAPSCRAFAEDVVLDRISRRACEHASWSKGRTT